MESPRRVGAWVMRWGATEISEKGTITATLNGLTLGRISVTVVVKEWPGKDISFLFFTAAAILN